MIVHPSTTTIRDVVMENFRTARIFTKYGFDFCDSADVTIEFACRDAGLNPCLLLEDLADVATASGNDEPSADTWETDYLVEHIVHNHHHYLRIARESTLRHALKVARAYGAEHPEAFEMAKILTLILSDLGTRMIQEERILFPYIRALARADRDEGPVPLLLSDTARHHMDATVAEHESAAEWMEAIRELTNDYSLQPEACLTCNVLLNELEDLERNLRRHAFLEKKILFPKALVIESRLSTETLFHT